MDRRNFLQVTGAALASSALAGCSTVHHTLPTPMPGPAPLDAAAFRQMRRFVQTSFGRIAYVEHGTGRVALFLHAYPLNSFQWRGSIERLSANRRCIAPDLMGLGYSEITSGEAITPFTQVRMLMSLLDSLSVDQADVIANDSGGMIAQLLVAQHPERVRSLLLTNCDVENDCPPRSFAPFVQLARAGVIADQMVTPALANKTAARGAKGIGGLAYQNPLNPTDEALDYYFAPLVSSSTRKAQLAALTIGLGENSLIGSEAKLKRFTRAVRIVWASADTVFSQASPDWLDRTFSGSRGVRRVEGAKLFFPEEQPELIASEARALWKE